MTQRLTVKTHLLHAAAAVCLSMAIAGCGDDPNSASPETGGLGGSSAMPPQPGNGLGDVGPTGAGGAGPAGPAAPPATGGSMHEPSFGGMGEPGEGAGGDPGVVPEGQGGEANENGGAAAGGSVAMGGAGGEGPSVPPAAGALPWEEAAAMDYAEPASAPDALIIDDDLHKNLAEWAVLSEEREREEIGGIALGDDGKFAFVEGTVPARAETIWHTHLFNTSFSSTDIAGFLTMEQFQFDTVRAVNTSTYVAMRTQATPANLVQGPIETEQEQLRNDIGKVMSDIEASHWANFEIARRYELVYYYAPLGSQTMQRVTTEGPSNVEDPMGYPSSVLD